LELSDLTLGTACFKTNILDCDIKNMEILEAVNSMYYRKFLQDILRPKFRQK
jgi:hypothetical protein